MTANDLNELFFLPLSQAALDELVALQILLQSVAYDENSNDTGIFFWGGQIYTSGKLYKLAFKYLQLHLLSLGFGNQSVHQCCSEDTFRFTQIHTVSCFGIRLRKISTTCSFSAHSPQSAGVRSMSHGGTQLISMTV
jgi:hypothetical protein